MQSWQRDLSASPHACNAKARTEPPLLRAPEWIWGRAAPPQARHVLAPRSHIRTEGVTAHVEVTAHVAVCDRLSRGVQLKAVKAVLLAPGHAVGRGHEDLPSRAKGLKSWHGGAVSKMTRHSLSGSAFLIKAAICIC